MGTLQILRQSCQVPWISDQDRDGVLNIFIERLWRSIKYEEVHLKAYADGCEARSGISSWMNFYNFRRPHQAMNNQMPMAVWRDGMNKIEAAARAVDMPLRLDNADALPT
jgi:putative transposase